ncbi:hypothetical protein ACFQO7_33990 [Catellatospora aurea]|uniref:Uncharacterized protein n=1 Tax=Catellatospora aurea TaxID=1337874 RepID=A0ABW2H5H2_9ACTN
MRLQALTAGGGASDDVALVHRLRDRGLLGNGSDTDVGLDRWCTASERSLPDAQRTARAACRALFPDDLPAFEDPFLRAIQAHGVHAVVYERLLLCLDFNAALRRRDPSLEFGRIRAGNIIDWFAIRWGRGDLEDAVLERGFAGVGDFVAAARPFCLFDKSFCRLPPLVMRSP